MNIEQKIISLYRKTIPARTRKSIYKKYLQRWILVFKARQDRTLMAKYILFHRLSNPKRDKNIAWKNWATKEISCYPYSWIEEYPLNKIKVSTDKENGLSYVSHHGKKLYFKRSMSPENITHLYRQLLIEQDHRSPHRYVDKYESLAQKTILDVGAAEGIFTLDAIDFIEHSYLFEADPEWSEALNATFSPYKEKISIISQYVSDTCSPHQISIDAFFREREKKKEKFPDNIFLKMDIEGAELTALHGSKSILSLPNISGSVCLYHKHNDIKDIPEFFLSNGLHIRIRKGFLYYENEMRHAIVHFSSNPNIIPPSNL